MEKIYSNGFRVRVRKDLLFEVVYPDGKTEDGAYPSLAAAEEHMSGISRARAVAAKTKLDLPVLDENGNSHLVVGIHLRHGTLLLKPSRKDSEDDFGENELYPDTPWLKTVLKKLAKLKSKVEEIEQRLEPFRIEKPWGYGSFDKDNYESAAKALIQQYKHYKARAEKAAHQGGG